MSSFLGRQFYPSTLYIQKVYLFINEEYTKVKRFGFF